MYKLISPHEFPDASPVRMVTGNFEKIASFTPPEIAVFLKTAQPAEGKTLILVNALGSGEHWGSNVNGDYFPEKALMNKGASYGYKTFEVYAKPYYHHINKDPKKAIGEVKVAAWNPQMHRVELLLEIDNKAGKDLVEKVAAGEHPDFSMGCKVPFDICSICNHQAKKVAHYCEHLKYGMNKISGDGKRAYAINTLPRFFDISHVLIGADKTAKLLKKVASAGAGYSSGVLGLQHYGVDVDEINGEAKKAEAQEAPKETLIDKAASKLAGMLEAYEPEIPTAVLNKLAEHPLGDILSTLGYSGVCLRPREFQRIVLVCVKKPELADELDRKKVVFTAPTDEEMEEVETDTKTQDLVKPENVKEDILKIIKPFIQHRSILRPHISIRITRVQALPKSKQVAERPEVKVGSVKEASVLALLGALGLSYVLYRRGFPIEAKQFEKVIMKKPWLAPVILGGAVAATNIGSAISGPTVRDEAENFLMEAQKKYGSTWKAIGTVVGPVGLAYLASASATRKQYRGHQLNAFERVMRDYPGPLGVLGVFGLLKARKAFSFPKMTAKV